MRLPAAASALLAPGRGRLQVLGEGGGALEPPLAPRAGCAVCSELVLADSAPSGRTHSAETLSWAKGGERKLIFLFRELAFSYPTPSHCVSFCLWDAGEREMVLVNFLCKETKVLEVSKCVSFNWFHVAAFTSFTAMSLVYS